MPSTSIDKTLLRLRRGGLPFRAAPDRLTDVSGNMACSGCGDDIYRLERFYYVRVDGGAPLRLHLVCYQAWLTFLPPVAPSELSCRRRSASAVTMLDAARPAG
jgi:hypothetical protein